MNTAEPVAKLARPARRTGVRWISRKRGRSAVIVTSGLLVILVVWHAAVSIFAIQSYLLPSPIDVVAALWRGVTVPLDSRVSLLYHLGTTLQEAGLGLLTGGCFGVLLGAWASSNRVVDGVLSPYVFALQGLPKIAIAPLLMIWFGFGLTTKALLAAFLVFFPMFVNTYTGLSTVDRDYERLFAGMQATPGQTLRHLRLPSASIMIFAGLEIAIVQALLGAIVGEFISAEAGMGMLLKQYQALANTAAMFAALIILGISGILLNGLIRLLQRRVIFWMPDREQETSAVVSS